MYLWLIPWAGSVQFAELEEAFLPATALSLGQIFDAEPAQLAAWCDPIAPAPADPLHLGYARITLYSLRGELELLKAALESLPIDHIDFIYAQAAARLRYNLRAHIFDADLLKLAAELALAPSFWQAELRLLLATLHMSHREPRKAQPLYMQAATGFLAQGCRRKYLRAKINVLVAESHIYPDRHLFAQYHDIYREALQGDTPDRLVALTAMLNVSREYQRAGALWAALKACDQALALGHEQAGDINFFLTLAHRAHLLFELHRLDEARLDYERAKLAPFAEVQTALAFLHEVLTQTPTTPTEGPSLPTWTDRRRERQEQLGSPRLSELEDRLVRFLAEGPRERLEIVDHLYGGQLDIDTKLNRFRSMLSTFRKKHPHLIYCQGGHYHLADEILVPKRRERTRA